LITWKPTGFYSRVSTRDCLKFRELNPKWYLLPRWLANTPIQIYGWEGSLTGKREKMPMDPYPLGSEDAPSNSKPH
jgi:hypothetical protein